MFKLHMKDPGSAITHFIAMILSILAATPLLLKSYRDTGRFTINSLSLAIFIVSMILLYAASTTYHTLDISPKVNRILRKIDHMMIFVLIAGSYTPVCLLVLDPKRGYPLLIAVWSLALIGIGIKFLWITCPKWFSSVIYIAMGWICVFVFSPIVHRLPVAAFGWLLAGGIIYTVGGIIYALKLPLFNARHQYFGSHEIFHLFVMGGSFCHFIFMYQYVIGLS